MIEAPFLAQMFFMVYIYENHRDTSCVSTLNPIWPPFSKWLTLGNIKSNLNFKNQARVFKFEVMDAIDTRIKNIKKKFFRS